MRQTGHHFHISIWVQLTQIPTNLTEGTESTSAQNGCLLYGLLSPPIEFCPQAISIHLEHTALNPCSADIHIFSLQRYLDMSLHPNPGPPRVAAAGWEVAAALEAVGEAAGMGAGAGGLQAVGRREGGQAAVAGKGAVMGAIGKKGGVGVGVGMGVT